MNVFLDAGHGGKNPGALGNGLREKDIALSVTLKVGEILKRHNIEVIYSRTTEDRGIKAANFAVLRQSNMPSDLVELAFITNVEDSKILRKKQDELDLASI
ncbi:N-acetylmuramoyl-L-alanine amidase family protein [Tissierella pigra]|nr:N-acetylmuramoyl-L-alanine amidase [Tissierella pigra]